jgi:ubiquinone/menaquinone biosynthesis C-methylase UbiE
MADPNTQSSYDRVAKQYAEQYLHEFDHKPLDRELLDRFASRVKGKGRACDLGCGPGQVARYLHEHGLDVMGIDLSPGMVEQARQAHPGIEFQQGDMAALPLADESLAGIAAFYSIIHIPRGNVTTVLQELKRVLLPGGVLLLAFHLGDEVRHVEELLGQPIALDFTFFQRAEMEGYLREAGLAIDESLERDPYPGVEYQGRRGYIFASKSV